MTWRSLGDSNPCFRRERALCINAGKRRRLQNTLYFIHLQRRATEANSPGRLDVWFMFGRKPPIAPLQCGNGTYDGRYHR